MTTYLMRHGRTAYSATYRVNGDPAVVVPLEPEGIQQCRAARAQIPIADITVCFTSAFARTAASARLVLTDQEVRPRQVVGLNEINYGGFEGGLFQDYAVWLREFGPWARPPAGTESQREAIIRMLKALRRTMTAPGARLVVGHGLLLSLVLWALTNPAEPLGEQCFFPEAPCATPITIGDMELLQVIDRILVELYCDNRSQPPGEPGRQQRRPWIRRGWLHAHAASQGLVALPTEEGTSNA